MTVLEYLKNRGDNKLAATNEKVTVGAFEIIALILIIAVIAGIVIYVKRRK